MNTVIKTTRRQGGFTAIELGVVLLVIGVLSIAVFQVMAGMVSAARFSGMGDQLVTSTLRLQQRYSTERPSIRYEDITLEDDGTLQTLTNDLQIAYNGTEIEISDTGTAALGSSNPVGDNGNSNLMWTLNNLEQEECKILIRKLVQPARAIVGDRLLYSSTSNEAEALVLSAEEINDTCKDATDTPENTFRAVF